MYNTFINYDIGMIKTRIKEVRELRWKQYSSSLDEDTTYSDEKKEYYKQFIYCKTQQSLADKISVNRIAVNSWENGKSMPALENLIDLCKVLDCSLDYLLGSVDTPELEPISKAAHYSKISSEIIRYGLEHPDYLDCLNYFMHPQNSSDFFNEITLNTWKKYIVNSSISEINGELKEYIIKCYDEYISTTPFNEIDKKTYRAFLESKLPSTKLSFSTKTVDGKIRLKSCVNLLSYQNFFDNKQFNYTTFINYLVEHTFESLSHNSIIELQKSKLAKCFVELFTKYIEEL